MGRARVLVVLVSMMALILVACSGLSSQQVPRDRGHQAADRDAVSQALPHGLWFSVDFPGEGTQGLRHTEVVDQPWLLPCPHIRLRADKQRAAAYGITSSHGGDEMNLVDSRQLVVYDEVSAATHAIEELATRLPTCAGGRTRISSPKVLDRLGDSSFTVDAVEQPILWDTIPHSGSKLLRQRLFITQRGRAIVTTSLAYDLGEMTTPGVDKGHLLLAGQLCVFDSQPCSLRDDVKGAPEQTLPEMSDLIPGTGKLVKFAGSGAAGPTDCSEVSIASLGAVSAVRHEYGDSPEAPAATLVLAGFKDQEAAREAQMHLNAALTDCYYGLPMMGLMGNDTDTPCWLEEVPVQDGEAQQCDAYYSTREAAPWTSDSDLPPRTAALATGVLRVGSLVVVADLAKPTTTDDDFNPGWLARVFRRIVKHLDLAGVHEPTYDGWDHVAAPVRLGMSAVQLSTLRDPLARPSTFQACTDIRLRSGSIATLDEKSQQVVAYRLGGADTTPRGISATATLKDALAAYPEGRQSDLEGHRVSEHSVEARLADGTDVSVMHGTDDRYTQVWIHGTRCADQLP